MLLRRVYIAGPMTGLPENNYPAFHAAAAAWRRMGYAVENPAENPPPACGSWAGWMRLGLVQLLRCNAIVLLPGWQQSPGAQIEHRLARELGMHVIEQRSKTKT